ncbi:BrnA antitoxin family protein [Paludibacterium purpuratum]|uniref:Uncharacterized protein (DUF4415 family) n=1 Tax=Paludibacterium purpuratum TaxID=1144873 RepID=A0A4R7AYK6_9NEIS|nr:BrnA antitoxin family protein [Paludibacterium purpuratum]TDR71638.1 uncharacterized protein (DUF4415 family) [Paludibacterium purpuratum]
MPKLKQGTILPSIEEDAAIDAGIAADPDTFEASAADFKAMKPMRGRPKAQSTKRPVTIRLDAEVVDAFQLGGEGWQTRINEVLKDYVQKHKVA